MTVLFCDLVGFTARAESRDPEDVEAILRRYHGGCARARACGGTVEKFVGDAVMAVFGAPVAHEDDPSGRCGRPRDPRWRTGAESRSGSPSNTGEALVSLGGRPESGEGMVSGDVVDTAGRLQAAAPENGDPRRRADLPRDQAARSSTARASVEAKGKAEPVPVWKASRPVAFRRRRGASRQTPLVGRERGARARSALARVRARAGAAARHARRRPGDRQVPARRGALRWSRRRRA